MKKKYFFIICGFILTIILTAVITTIIVKNNNKNKINEGKNIESNNNINIKETNKPDFNEEKALNEDVLVNEKEKTEQEKDILKVEHKNKEEKDEESKPDNTPNETDVPIQKTEEDIIKYVEEISLEETGDKIKKGFVTVVDFIFYDGKIYGKTFFELSSTAKIKIISLALKIN